MATCPNCGSSSERNFAKIWVDWAFAVKPPGTWSLAGAQEKFVATRVLRMSCECGWHIDGYIEGEEFCGWAETQHFPASDGGRTA